MALGEWIKPGHPGFLAQAVRRPTAPVRAQAARARKQVGQPLLREGFHTRVL